MSDVWFQGVAGARMRLKNVNECFEQAAKTIDRRSRKRSDNKQGQGNGSNEIKSVWGSTLLYHDARDKGKFRFQDGRGEKEALAVGATGRAGAVCPSLHSHPLPIHPLQLYLRTQMAHTVTLAQEGSFLALISDTSTRPPFPPTPPLEACVRSGEG